MAFTLSGCFVMRTLTFKDDTVQASEKTQAPVGVAGDTTELLAAGDDGDDVPEDEGSSDDRYNCQPPYASLIRIKGGTPTR